MLCSGLDCAGQAHSGVWEIVQDKDSAKQKAGILASLNPNRLVKLHWAHQHHAHTPGLAVSRAGLMWGNSPYLF